jgi:glucuronosyltransferase
MSFFQRLSNWFTFAYMNIGYKLLTETKTKNLLIKKFGDDHINVGELPRKVSMTFVNQHYSLSGAKHLSPNVVELGGIHINKAKPLDPVSLFKNISVF